MITNRNLDLHKGMKRTRDEKYVGKYTFFSYFKNFLKRKATIEKKGEACF